MWKTSGLLIYVLVPRSFCEILRGGLFLHFLLSRLKKNILVNCIYGIIPLTGRGTGYVRWPCLVTKLCPDPALSSDPAQLTSMAWGSGQSKPSLFHLKNCYNMISFFSAGGLLLSRCHTCRDEMEKPKSRFCHVVEAGWNSWLLSQERLLFSLNHPLRNIMQCLWTAATVSLANAQVNISNHIVLRSSRKPTASLSSWPSHHLPVTPVLFLTHWPDFSLGEMSCSEAPAAENP